MLVSKTVDRSEAVPNDIWLFLIFDHLSTEDLLNLARANKRLHALLVNSYGLYLKHNLPRRLVWVKNGFDVLVQFKPKTLNYVMLREENKTGIMQLPFILVTFNEFIMFLSGAYSHTSLGEHLLFIGIVFLIALALFAVESFAPGNRQTLGSYLEAKTTPEAQKNQITKVLAVRQKPSHSILPMLCCKKFFSRKQFLVDFVSALRDYIENDVCDITKDLIRQLRYFETKQPTTVQTALQNWQNMKTALQSTSTLRHFFRELGNTVDRCSTQLGSVHELYQKNKSPQFNGVAVTQPAQPSSSPHL